MKLTHDAKEKKGEKKSVRENKSISAALCFGKSYKNKYLGLVYGFLLYTVLSFFHYWRSLHRISDGFLQYCAVMRTRRAGN